MSERPTCTIPKPSKIIPIARISPKIKSDRLLTTVSGSFAANAVVVIPSANAPTMTIVQ